MIAQANTNFPIDSVNVNQERICVFFRIEAQLK
ncbi:hypothetical protein IMCC3135_11210 [Granulosicoccus antarcticus IMCC3135]|uniref:Uncharacterized protein n=1 Tax=Granulosicoccus antarcticus IMCC3135 TaxID=1192854 RepID=A0A2Z2NLL5_9GAMM|nr:hypothetical protein IMCC3135_11210 [Granulosicoccus antarcticus IMCC3135]